VATLSADFRLPLRSFELTLALDGERTVERRRDEPAAVRLTTGPLTIDVDAVMRRAARDGLLHGAMPQA
jgi:hypothetical protein